MPINVARWPAHYVPTVLTDEVSLSKEPWLKPIDIDNIATTFDYLAFSSTITQSNERLQQVAHDMAVISAAHEISPSIGAIFAGDFANEQYATYTNQIVEDAIDPNIDNEFNKLVRLKLRGGPGLKGSNVTVDGTLFNGVGLFQQNIPKADRVNPIKGLTTQRRASANPIWSYKPFNSRGRATATITSISISCRIGRFVAKKLNSVSLYKIVSFVYIGCAVYFYTRYIVYCLKILNSLKKYKSIRKLIKDKAAYYKKRSLKISGLF